MSQHSQGLIARKSWKPIQQVLTQRAVIGSLLVIIACAGEFYAQESNAGSAHLAIPSGLHDSACRLAFSSSEGKGSHSDFDAGTGSCVDGTSTCGPVIFAQATFAKPRLAAFARKSYLAQFAEPFLISQCQQLRLADTPNWLTATFWAGGKSYLGMLNSYRGEISVLDAHGYIIKKVENEVPVEAVVNYQGRLLAKGHGNTFFFLADDLKRTQDAFTLPGFGSLYSGWVVNGDEIVAYGSVPSAHSANGFDLGFLRIDINNRVVRMVHPFEYNRFYLINNQYLATTNGDAYFVAMNKKAVIYRLPKGRPAYPLKAMMPKEYSKITPLRDDFVGEDAIKQRFGQLEALRMPVGLYGFDGFIYLLGRNPGTCSPWSLTKIDPIHEKFKGTIPLPTFARHLTLVPGEKVWLLVEKGAVAAPGQQSIKTIKTVPTSWITQPEVSPLRSRAELQGCLTGD